MNIFIPTHWTAAQNIPSDSMEALAPLQSSIDYAVDKVGSDLGFTLKLEQKISLLLAYLFPCQLVMENPCAIFYCLSCLML